jgi:Protein tyrosine and serine/threonine kinase
MGVWRAKSPNWTASKSPKPGDAGYEDNSDMPELALDSSNSKNEKYLYERSRSASTEKLLQSSICRDPSLSGRRNDAAASSSAHDGDCHGGKDATLHLTLPESPAPSTRNSTHDMPRSHYALHEPICVEYLPPTWDPLSDFCFPVADVPVARLVPDNMEMWHFDEIQHIADGSNANVFLAMFNGEKVIIKMIRAEVQTDPVAVHEFDVEHGILVRVSHPNIIKIMGAGRFPRRFIVLEFLGGGTLGNILGSNIVKPALWERMFHRSTFGFFNLLLKARDLASALHYLHSNVVKGATIIHRG